MKVTMDKLEVYCDMGLLLLCASEEHGCEKNSLDPYAYICDYLHNYVLCVLRTEDVKMVKQHKKYYVVSGTDSTFKFVLEVKNNS